MLLPAWRLPLQSEAPSQGGGGVRTAAGWGFPCLTYMGGQARQRPVPWGCGLRPGICQRHTGEGVRAARCPAGWRWCIGVPAPCAAPRVASRGGDRRLTAPCSCGLPFAHGPLGTARAGLPGLQGARCCVSVPAPWPTRRVGSRGEHRRAIAAWQRRG